MGKDLKGKEPGKGLSQRPDGRYAARAQVQDQHYYGCRIGSKPLALTK